MNVFGLPRTVKFMTIQLDQKVEDVDDDELLDLLDDEEAFNGYREQRKAELARLLDTAKRNARNKDQGYGDVTKVNEREVLEISTSVKFCVVHFSHPEFRRCEIMQKKLKVVAQDHFETRFVQVDAGEAPFLATKLNIKVLPCVVGFANGKEVLRIVGFEGLTGNGQDFSVESLEDALADAKVIKRL